MAMWGNMTVPRWKNVRDVVLFMAGLAGVFHETVIVSTERPTLLLMFAAMMGLPAFLRTDEREARTSTHDEGTEMMMERMEENEHRDGP